jgi:hypothetical protein
LTVEIRFGSVVVEVDDRIRCCALGFPQREAVLSGRRSGHGPDAESLRDMPGLHGDTLCERTLQGSRLRRSGGNQQQFLWAVPPDQRYQCGVQRDLPDAAGTPFTHCGGYRKISVNCCATPAIVIQQRPTLPVLAKQGLCDAGFGCGIDTGQQSDGHTMIDLSGHVRIIGREDWVQWPRSKILS